MQGNPQIGGIAAQRLAEEPGRGHADHGERMALDDERGANHRWVCPVRALPQMMTDHHNRRGRRRIIVGCQHAAAERGSAERREIGTGHVLGPHRPCGRLPILTPHADAWAGSLERRELLELRQLGLQPFEERKREHAPAILRAALDAAGVAVADAIQARGIADGQRPQHDSVDQREDGRGAADSQRERQDRGDGEDPRGQELPQRVAHFADEACHVCSVCGCRVRRTFGPATRNLRRGPGQIRLCVSTRSDPEGMASRPAIMTDSVLSFRKHWRNLGRRSVSFRIGWQKSISCQSISDFATRSLTTRFRRAPGVSGKCAARSDRGCWPRSWACGLRRRRSRCAARRAP